jgi:glycosyltransferase 2 family protein
MAKLRERACGAPVRAYNGGGGPPHAHAPRVGTSTPPVGGAPGPDGEETVHLSPQAIQALDLAPDEVAEEEQLEEEVPRQAAIGKRLGDWRTLLSFGIAAAILVFAVGKAGINWGTALHTLRHANLALFVLAVVVYYASFPIRTYRWRCLMRNANHGALQRKIARFPLIDLTQILYLSWFANVVIPAKLGDVYRAYLARRWLGVSLSRTVGTILAERILDLVVLFPLLLVSAFLTFQAKLLSTHDSKITYALLVGLILSVVAGGVLVVIWRAGDSVLRVLPHRVHDVYLHFRHGAIHSFGSEAPALVGQTVAVWLLEGARLTCILWALGLLAPGKVGPMAALFLALGSSVLTTLPLTPGGLGFVEPFIFTVLALLGVAGGISTGAAVAVLDRIISYLSIAVIGFFLYAFTDKAHVAPAASPPSSTATR